MRLFIGVGLFVAACSGTPDVIDGVTEPNVGGGDAGEPSIAGVKNDGGNVGGGSGSEPAQFGGAGGEAEAAGSGGEAQTPMSGGTGGSNGGAAGKFSGGTSGSGGSVMMEPDIDECGGGGALVCDGLCGEAPSSLCSTCNAFSSSSGRFVLGSKTNPENQERKCSCSGATLRLNIDAGTCSRFTVQDGATVTFFTAKCSAASQCLVVSGFDKETGSMSPNVAFVGRPSQNAWVNQEVADLGPDGTCPLRCN